MEQLIKWTWTKRSQVKQIFNYIPDNINTYYELFLWSWSLFYHLLESQHHINKYIVNDLNIDVIKLHKYLLYNDINNIINTYTFHRNNLLKMWKEYYYQMRDNFNITKEVSLFLFLNRNCLNWLIRYNSNNKFNTWFHHNRYWINPNKLLKIISQYRKLIEWKNIIFESKDYKEYWWFSNNDYIYLDPPYTDTWSKMYLWWFDEKLFLNYLQNINCKFWLSYNCKRNDSDFKSIYLKNYKCYELKSWLSSFNRLQSRKVDVIEYFYTNI